MKYVVIRINGRQYKAEEGRELVVDKTGKDIKVEVLFYTDGKKVIVGKPVLKEAKVKVKIVKEEEKGQKVDVIRYKAKSRYRKHTGIRPKYTRILIEKITV